ncbi:MAG TPA: hypothetical protein DDW52_03115 [Planctomycetaceae bacterium]|nr:hypothetical protein [Planctomycetaceae bacterium]
MANGTPGKKAPNVVRVRALELLKSLTVKQVCDRLGVSKSCVRNWRREEREAAENG